MTPLKVLITGCGAPGAPGIIKSLRNNHERPVGIVGVDVNPDNCGAFLVDEFHQVPRPTDPDFVPTMLRICRQSGVRVVLPLVTKELMVFSENLERFSANGIQVPVSPPRSLAIANNKARLLEFLHQRGIPAPAFEVVDSLDAFKEALSALGHPTRRVCFKPPVSNGSRGFRVVDDSVDQLDLLLNHKPDHTFVSYAGIVELLARARQFPTLVVMEYLPGDEYSVDLLVDNGKPLYTIPRRRHAIKAGISTVGSTERNTPIIDYCNVIAGQLKLHGNIGIQVKADADNRFKMLEINPRVQGTIALCVAAGVNLPYLGVKLALGEPLPSDVEAHWGVKMFRCYDEVYVNPQGARLEYPGQRP